MYRKNKVGLLAMSAHAEQVVTKQQGATARCNSPRVTAGGQGRGAAFMFHLGGPRIEGLLAITWHAFRHVCCR